MQTKDESMIVICSAYAKNRDEKHSMSESERVTLEQKGEEGERGRKSSKIVMFLYSVKCL